jgi:hypothetical protein
LDLADIIQQQNDSLLDRNNINNTLRLKEAEIQEHLSKKQSLENMIEKYNSKARAHQKLITEQGATNDTLNTRVSKLNTTITNHNETAIQDTETIRTLKADLKFHKIKAEKVESQLRSELDIVKSENTKLRQAQEDDRVSKKRRLDADVVTD